MGDVAIADRRAHQSEGASHPNMIWIPGGTFRMGSHDHSPEEAPAHCTAADGLWIGCTPVTNRQFKQFVRSTGRYRPAAQHAQPIDTSTSHLGFSWVIRDHNGS
jgi:formylglycine-generating enzyme